LAVRVRRAFAIRQIAIMAETQIAIAISGSMGREELYQPRFIFLVASLTVNICRKTERKRELEPWEGAEARSE